MVHPNRQRALTEAWGALAESEGGDGWRTISIHTSASCALMAGRKFPDNQEGVLFGFLRGRIPQADQLPQGRGFAVSALGRQVTGERAWVAISRMPTANSELFLAMAVDLIASVENRHAADDDILLLRLLNRIRTWQFFMERDRPSILGRKAEIGLFGELVLLEDMLALGVAQGAAVDGWRGPLEDLHDFRFGPGAIEVKTTAANAGFPACISQIEQLDSPETYPFYLAAVRLAEQASGQTLAEKIEQIRGRLSADERTLEYFDRLVLQAGFLTVAAEHYHRRLHVVQVHLLEIGDDFPRLQRSRLPEAVIGASYTLDLSQIQAHEHSLEEVLLHLGVMSDAA